MKYLLILSLISVLISGCATTKATPLPRGQKVPGIYHRVEKGQTLWKISKAYNIDMKQIIEANRLSDAGAINEGQLLFIQGAKSTVKIKEPADSEKAQAFDSGDFMWPLNGKVISFFGAKVGNVKNKGIDIKADAGKDVLASRSGIISYCSENLKSYGRTIIIDHRDGFSTVYAHNQQILVKPGDRVAQGQVIAKAGSVNLAQNSFLHFEIRKKHEAVNPFYYLP